MKVTSDQAFLAMYFLLDKYYIECKQVPDLGVLVGIINPFLWEDRTPIDPGTIYDWNKCKVNANMASDELLTEEESYGMVIAYLKFYITNYGFNFTDVISDLSENPSWRDAWSQSIEKAVLQEDE